jgi:hypothetical protein
LGIAILEEVLTAGILEIEYLVAETFTEDADDWHIKDVKEF